VNRADWSPSLAGQYLSGFMGRRCKHQLQFLRLDVIGNAADQERFAGAGATLQDVRGPFAIDEFRDLEERPLLVLAQSLRDCVPWQRNAAIIGR
jgi:hypothetical protein